MALASLLSGVVYYAGLFTVEFALLLFANTRSRIAQGLSKGLALVLLAYLAVGFALLAWPLALFNIVLIYMAIVVIMPWGWATLRWLDPDRRQARNKLDAGEVERFLSASSWQNDSAARSGFLAPSEPDPHRLVETHRMLKSEPARARWEFAQLAEKGSAYATVYLAASYDAGRGDAADHDLAGEWYRRAAATGWPYAHYAYGSWCSRARHWADCREQLERSARLGYLPAILQFGRLYASGILGRVDYGQAAHWYELAHARGNLAAQASLAIALVHGPFHPVRLLRGLWLWITVLPRMLEFARTERVRAQAIASPAAS